MSSSNMPDTEERSKQPTEMMQSKYGRQTDSEKSRETDNDRQQWRDVEKGMPKRTIKQKHHEITHQGMSGETETRNSAMCLMSSSLSLSPSMSNVVTSSQSPEKEEKNRGRTKLLKMWRGMMMRHATIHDGNNLCCSLLSCPVFSCSLAYPVDGQVGSSHRLLAMCRHTDLCTRNGSSLSNRCSLQC